MKWGGLLLAGAVVLMILSQVATVLAPEVVPEVLRFRSAEPRPLPSDRIREDAVHVYPDRIVIDISGAAWARFAPTRSMEPVLGDSVNAIQVVPESSDQIKVGDIISFQLPGAEEVIIHRVVEIGSDEEGWFAVTKGDNNAQADPGRRRFTDISRVLVAIIY
mgnify:CR=1 FL=1